jgi:hypothetical protein
MASKVLPGYVVASLLLVAGLTTSAEAQVYGPYAPGSYPYGGSGSYPYSGYGYLPQYDYYYYFFPYASRYLQSQSYTPSPYRPMPGAGAYGTPPYTYSPDAYNYDLTAASFADYFSAFPFFYDYYPPYYYYPPPAAPYGYNGYSYYPFIPRRWRSPYRPMPLPEYLYRQFHGPTRVRDIVPGIPELGG